MIVVSQKVVSKAEGRTRGLADVEPGPRAVALADQLGRDPRLIELVLGETRRIVRAETAALIVETNGGWICANAGIDASNVPGDDDGRAAARRCRRFGAAPARRVSPSRLPARGRRVIIADSFGRPWRLGQAEVAIGCAGIVPLDDWRGRADTEGRELTATAVAVADQLAGGGRPRPATRHLARPAVLDPRRQPLVDSRRRPGRGGASAPRRRRPVPLSGSSWLSDSRRGRGARP